MKREIYNTIILKINPENPETETIERAAEVIRKGGLVIYPTETVYGLGASAFNPTAVERVYQVKMRPTTKPLGILISEREELSKLVKTIPEAALKLMDKFWPGPLTLVFEASPLLPLIVRGGTNTIGIRISRSKVARSLVKAAGVPIVSPSANISGERSPLTATEVYKVFDGLVEMILDGGATFGIESTILDITEFPPKVLRRGRISVEELESSLGYSLKR